MSVLSDRIRHKLESNLDMLMNEYKIATGQSENYFSLMYLCINFTFALYGAILTLGQSLFGKNENSDISLIIFLYLLPISTYVLGLFYAYNAVVISKYGFFLIKIENDIINLNRRLGFPKHLHGWNIFSKKVPGGFILPYGSMLGFYLVLSPASIIYGMFLINLEQMTDAAFVLIFVYFMPWFIYLLYMIFMLYLIYQMFKCKKMYNYVKEQESLQYEADFHV